MFISEVNQEEIEMNESKTLKDLTGMIGMLPLKSDILDINVVKQEAIKQIKEKREEQNKLIKSAENYNECFNAFEYVIIWIKHFFNITEEDLKTKSREYKNEDK